MSDWFFIGSLEIVYKDNILNYGRLDLYMLIGDSDIV